MSRRLSDALKLFDLIVFDLPAPTTAAGNRFFTLEAFRAARARLREGGILAFSLPSSAHYLAGERELLLASVYRALEAAFGEVSFLAGDSIVFVAGAPAPGLDVLAGRFGQRPATLELASGHA
ncbi:MAG TPA: hypothetical protein HPP77_07735 [Candidatus Hydrogenedentes bacterium]|nr:hypothetical protein [Candidatus Hydrogenedentota bacterium]